ncbi:ABC transporter ATP-binding protein [Leptolyngbya sp. FACHB-671]|uniref:ATP-binding cassette domain-containing protein n=1 Tax=Leptolyngbya sp. FACHB-671 TaxID=2692812 RepID=UPI0016839DB5|nr:ABC transporter ATP-binding protein [Leptolyngbya sp. FACHB-671]MBD2070184.1 ABC transporter ATP-binding protein [Leptolyngbya sp. FACHB-671]
MTTQRIAIWKLLWRMIRYAFGLYLLDTILWLFIAGLPVVPGLIIREFFNTLTSTETSGSAQLISLQSPMVWVALIFAVGAARIVAIFAGRVTKTQHRFTMSSLLRRNLLDKLLQRPGAESLTVGRKTVSPGEVISFFRDDAAQVEDTVVGTNEIFSAGVFALVALIILFNVNARLTLLVFLPLVAIALTLQHAEARIKRYRSASRQATQQVTGLIGELFSAVQAIQVAGAETPVLNHLRWLGDQRQQRVVQDQVFTAIIQSSLENLVSLGTGLILLVAAQSGVGGGDLLSETLRERTLSVGDFALFVYYLAFVTDFLWFFGGFLALTKQTEVSLERMGTLISSVEEQESNRVEGLVEPAPLYLPDLKGRMTELPAIAQPKRDTALEELRVENLTYRYPGGDTALQRWSDRGITNISMTLKRGSLTVITGRVGSGKTTLLRVLLGLLPRQSGEIYWNGSRIEQPDQFFVPPRSAYTPQVPQLFSNTLQENLLMGFQTDEAELRKAIAIAALDHDLAAMPEELNTLIGSKGMRLSGGQQQRAAAARMLLRRPELLVFDDLSSALDLETEQTLWSHLLAATPRSPISYNPTYLVVSHRPFVLRQADYIIVLENGVVDTAGKPEDLNIVM